MKSILECAPGKGTEYQMPVDIYYAVLILLKCKPRTSIQALLNKHFSQRLDEVHTIECDPSKGQDVSVTAINEGQKMWKMYEEAKGG